MVTLKTRKPTMSLRKVSRRQRKNRTGYPRTSLATWLSNFCSPRLCLYLLDDFESASRWKRRPDDQEEWHDYSIYPWPMGPLAGASG